jgi:2-polyprenyl-6-methoxyphenol hydroxylase-like FAD-dependent oxidoreductase
VSTDQPAVAIVGSGIAGSALAAALATAGVPVLLLERTEEFVDHVRGEYMHPWGVAEAIQLGLHGDLINAGGNVISRFVGYDEVYSQAEVEAGALPLADLVPGVPGALGIGHPTACQALFDAAVQAGAVGLRGVEQVRVTAGARPEVRYVHGGSEHEVRPRLVVAADGRESSTRRQLGIEVEKTDPRIFLAGMLVDGVRDWPSTDSVIGTSGDTILYVFPQGEDKARLYIGYSIEDKTRLAGADKANTLLEAFRVDTIPDCGRFVDASPAGPCAAYPMFDSWCDAIVADGVVFAGDAAGFSDPTIGEGLSVALRDARMIRDILLGGEDWSEYAFTPYVEERAERMRRLRFAVQVFTDAHIPLGPDGMSERRRRSDLMTQDPDLFMLVAAMTCGPELAPETCFTEQIREKLLTSTLR